MIELDQLDEKLAAGAPVNGLLSRSVYNKSMFPTVQRVADATTNPLIGKSADRV